MLDGHAEFEASRDACGVQIRANNGNARILRLFEGFGSDFAGSRDDEQANFVFRRACVYPRAVSDDDGELFVLVYGNVAGEVFGLIAAT